MNFSMSRGVGTDAFDHAAALTDDDLLSPATRISRHDVVFLHVRVDDHFTRVGNFIEVGEDFLDDLRDEKAHGLVRELALGKYG